MKKFYWVVATLAAATPWAAQAQDTGALEEIVVTAQRREQNLQEVPISVTAFSGDQIERANIKGAADYLALTPNVSYTEDGQSGSRGLGIAVRGINNLVSGENAVINSVGIYLDEFSVASVPNQVANPFLPDMERVEILRGPQGTYFGRNSLGGALNLVTHAPSNTYEGEIRVGGESYAGAGEMYNFTGIFNAPISDTFRIRGVAFYEDSSGLVKNIGPGTKDSGHKWTNVRVRAVWEPTEHTRFGTTLIYANENQGTDENVPSGIFDLDTVDTFGTVLTRTDPLVPRYAYDPGTGFWPDNQNKLSHDLRESNKLDTTVAIVNFAHDLSEHLTFKAVAGLVNAEQKRLFDNDLIGNLDLLVRTNDYKGQSWSGETRLESRTDRVDWVVGALYARDDQDQVNDVAISTDPTATFNGDGFLPPFPTGLGLALNTKSLDVESIAAFGDVVWHVDDSLDLIAGARYTRDKVAFGRSSYDIAPVNPPSPPPSFGFFQSFQNIPRPSSFEEVTFSDVSPRFGMRYKTSENTNVFATISKGYKAGGVSTGNNTNASGSPAFSLPYAPEELLNIELGIKSELADHRVRLNASVFVLRWKDLQVEAFRFLTPGDLSSNFEQTVNIPKAEGKGIEVELLAKPTDRFTVGGSLGYLETEITEQPVTSSGQPGVEITGGFIVDVLGMDIPKAPAVTANLFGEYRWPVGNNSAWLRGEVLYRDSQYSDIEALTNRQTDGVPSPNQGLIRDVGPNEFPYKVPEFSVVNLRGGFEWQRASLSLYVQNLLDEKYYTGTQENFGLSGIRLRPHPRVYGASVSFKF